MKVLLVGSMLSVCLIMQGQQSDDPVSRHDFTEERIDSKINPVYLLLGTLSEYMGRSAYIGKRHQVDNYYYYEEPLVRFIDSMIRTELKISISETFINGRYETFSEELSEMVNSYYRNDLIDDSLFKTPGETCSFLTGRYYRYGEQLNDSVFKIQMPNSPNHQLIDTLLRRIGCTRVYFRYLKNLPAQFIHYFVPTDELKSFFMNISDQKKALDNEFKKAARKILGPEKDYDEMVRNKNERDLIKVIEYFKESELK